MQLTIQHEEDDRVRILLGSGDEKRPTIEVHCDPELGWTLLATGLGVVNCCQCDTITMGYMTTDSVIKRVPKEPTLKEGTLCHDCGHSASMHHGFGSERHCLVARCDCDGYLSEGLAESTPVSRIPRQVEAEDPRPNAPDEYYKVDKLPPRDDGSL